MLSILPRLESAFPWLHERPGDEDDFLWFTETNGIEVIYRPDVPKGVWATAAGRQFILLDSRLRGWLLRHVMFHELGHVLLHAPTQSSYGIEFCDPRVRRKQHVEAEQVAALCLLPPAEIQNVCESGAHFEYPELGRLLIVRMEFMRATGV